MNFYTKQHDYYCGIDLHAQRMYLYIRDAQGHIVLHRNLKTRPEDLLVALLRGGNFPLAYIYPKRGRARRELARRRSCFLRAAAGRRVR